jgi:hypothetical protein
MQHAIVAEKPEQSVNGPEATTPTPRRPRKDKRVDANGKPMHRLVLVCSEAMLGHINAAIAERSSLGFTKSYGGPRIPRTGQQDEIKGLALGLICEDWISGMEGEDEES